MIQKEDFIMLWIENMTDEEMTAFMTYLKKTFGKKRVQIMDANCLLNLDEY
jgi:hypothetical protein